MLFDGVFSGLDGPDDLAGLHALGAYFGALGRVILHYSYVLEIGQPSALCPWGAQSPRPGVNVSYVLSELGALSADLTSVCHIGSSVVNYSQNCRKYSSIMRAA